MRGWRGVIGSTSVFAKPKVRVRTPSPTPQPQISFTDRVAAVLRVKRAERGSWEKSWDPFLTRDRGLIPSAQLPPTKRAFMVLDP